jgi:hypothetical protein
VSAATHSARAGTERRPWLANPGVINYPHHVWVGKTGTHDRLQGGDDGCLIQRGVGQAPLDGSSRDAADGFRNGFGMPALGARGGQAPQVLLAMPLDFCAPEQQREPGVGGRKRPRALAKGLIAHGG